MTALDLSLALAALVFAALWLTVAIRVRRHNQRVRVLTKPNPAAALLPGLALLCAAVYFTVRDSKKKQKGKKRHAAR